MKKWLFLRSYLVLIAFLLLFLNLPNSWVEPVRSKAVGWIAPLWKQLAHLKLSFVRKGEAFIINEEKKTLLIKEELARLSLENQLLRNQLSQIQELFNQQLTLVELKNSNEEGREKKNNFPLPFRSKEREKIFALAIQSLPARVIYRSPSSWNNSFWIDVGKQDCQRLGHTIVAKNSPVVVGCTVVGLIDEVGNNESRVRLITDPQLTPAVRTVRVAEGKSWYLGKGELKGSVQLKGRTRKQILQGTGFNYDFPDAEGPARDLATGKVYGKEGDHYPAMPIVAPNDWLITSGMDGVFPPGLLVAKVSCVHVLKEGDYFYELEAIPCCGNLDDLTLVSVLPPVHTNTLKNWEYAKKSP